MSNHLKALGKLRKNVLGLSTENLDTEIKSLSERRDKLPTLIYEKTDEATAAEVLANMVDKYHLKEASLVERENKEGGTIIGFPSAIEVTTFIEAINEELSAKCETQTVIDSAKKKVIDFFAVEEGGLVGSIDGGIDVTDGGIDVTYGDIDGTTTPSTRTIDGGIDGTTTSSILNYQKFNSNSYSYVDNSKYLDFINLVEKGDLKIEFELTNPQVPTKKSFDVVERLALAYRDTYIKKYTEYLPDFAQLKYFINQVLEYEFGKYEPKIREEGEEVSEIEKLKSNYTQFTNDIIGEISYLFYGKLSKSDRINSIESYRKNISIAVLNLATQNDNSKNILRTYGEDNLIVVKDSLNSLNKENDEIDTKITTLQNEKTTINEFDLERREQLEDLNELIGGVDTTFIDKAGLSEGSIISAKSAHIESLKIYSGARVDKIIKEAIAEGKFEVEVFELTDIEAKLLLDAGYYIKETTEVNVIDPNNIAGGRRKEILTTWTINWESANSILGEEAEVSVTEVPKEPLP